MEFILFMIVMLFLVLIIYGMNPKSKKQVLVDNSKKLCKWNNGQPCPHKVILRTEDPFMKGGWSIYKTKESSNCCKNRHNRMKLSKLLADGCMNCTKQMSDDAAKRLEEHKNRYPEEHEHLFGTKNNDDDDKTS